MQNKGYYSSQDSSGGFATHPRNKATLSSSHYSHLPEDSPLRQRAMDLETKGKLIASALANATYALDAQKNALPVLLNLSKTISDTIRDRPEKEDHDIVTAFRDTAKRWLASIQKAEAEMNIPMALAYAPLPVLLSEINEIGDESIVSQDEKWEALITSVDNVVNELEECHLTGYGDVLNTHNTFMGESDKYQSDCERILSELHQTLKNKSNDVLEEQFTAKADDGNANISVPDNVPNYRLSIDDSPRQCQTCRFYKAQDGGRGECVVFDFSAKDNYVCDAWQAKRLSGSHTMVRNETVKTANAPINIERRNFSRDVTGDISVIGRRVDPVPIEDLRFEIIRETQYKHDTQTYRYLVKRFLPGDIVYSKMFRTLAEVTGVSDIDGQKCYELRFINEQGESAGSAITLGADLEPRGRGATKSRKNNKIVIKSSDDIDSMIEITRDVHDTLKRIVDDHKDITANPISYANLISPLNKHMLQVMALPLWANVTTGPKRKYFRALQDATYSIGSARIVLHQALIEAGKRQNADEPKKMIAEEIIDGQNKALDRLENALQKVADCLTLPSATHGDEAPGIKKYTGHHINDAIIDLAIDSVAHNSYRLPQDNPPDGYVLIEVVRFADDQKAVETTLKDIGDLNGIAVTDRHTGDIKYIKSNVISTSTENTNADNLKSTVLFSVSV